MIIVLDLLKLDNLSKNISTCAAVFVSKPKSINSAPNEKAPSTTLIPPDAIPVSYTHLTLPTNREV